jgi:serine/threonine protein kinase
MLDPAVAWLHTLVQAATNETMATGGRIATGDSIAEYEIGDLAGRGGMGEVYRALDTRLERPVALKLLAERLSHDESFRVPAPAKSTGRAAVRRPTGCSSAVAARLKSF